MTEDQEQHLRLVIEDAIDLIDKKYRKGQAEHGGDLTDMSSYDLIRNAIDENVDSIVYLLTALYKLPSE